MDFKRIIQRLTFILLQTLNVALSTIIGGTLSWLTLNLSRKSYEANLYSSAIGAGFFFSVLTYIAFIIYRRVNNKGEHVLRKELIFCYVFSIFLWCLGLSVTYGITFDQVTTFGLTISVGVVFIPLFKRYVEPLLLRRRT